MWGRCCGTLVVVMLSSFVDIYFGFYVWSSEGVLLTGQCRSLSDSRNVHCFMGPEQWEEFRETFGPKWMCIWEFRETFGPE